MPNPEELGALEKMKNNFLFAIKLKDKTCASIALETYREYGVIDSSIEELIPTMESIIKNGSSKTPLQCKADALESGELCENCSS